MSLLKSFLPDEANRRLFPAFVIFCIGCIGAAICVLASFLSIGWLYQIGFGIGFVSALIFVGYVWWHIFRSSRRREQRQ